VRKAAYQSLGTFISTFYISGCSNDQSLDQGGQSKAEESNSSHDLSEDSASRETLDSSTSSATAAEDLENRHPVPQNPYLSNSSTPVRNPPTQYGSNSESGGIRVSQGDQLGLDFTELTIANQKGEGECSNSETQTGLSESSRGSNEEATQGAGGGDSRRWQ